MANIIFMSDDKYLVALCSFTDFGPRRVTLLINYFKNAKRAWNVEKKDLLEVGVKDNLADKFIKYRNSFNCDKYFSSLEQKGISYIVKGDKLYPKNLKELDDAPVVLYSLGKLSIFDENAVAIVGTRKMTYYGKEVTEKFSSELASLGITIISGLARGIDSVAHRSALNMGGRTIAVIASGLDNIYPPENIKLANDIVKSGGAILSEYPLGYPALPVNFPSRNRIVSGLSKAVVVIEGYKKSGTLLTASSAAQQGKTVFAVPGQITSPMSEAPHYLLQNGAKWAFCPKDILDELSLEVKVDRDKVAKVLPDSRDEEKIIKLLEAEPLHLDELVRISGGNVSKISSTLMSMRLKGLVKEVGGGVYKKI